MTDSTKSMRLQVTVPKWDAIVFEWVGVQKSISESIRAVIKDYVARRGMTDAACQPMMIMDNIPETASYDVETLASEHNDSTDTAVEEIFVLENASEMSAAVQEEYESTALNNSEEIYAEFRPVIDEVHFEEICDAVKDKPVLSSNEKFKSIVGCTVEEFDKLYSDCHNSTTDVADSTSEISQQDEN